MAIWGKIFGAMVGFGLGHSLMGAVLGLAVGHWIDRSFATPGARPPFGGTTAAGREAARRQQVFTESVVTLAAKLAKADGPVTRIEVDAFKALFVLPPGQMGQIADLWDRARETPEGFEAAARRLAECFAFAPPLLAEVLNALNRVALADGPLHPAEEAFLARVADIFGLSGRHFHRDERDAADPYALLGVSRGADMAEIKAAWRRLSRENHPDALAAKGMPQDYIAIATKKMAEINAAYDRIRTERGEH
ncbi:DnaJ-like protein DjlA [mine drainage metagenome]|uniref:DnaJ-like protein DjlA n=1 Tax=mine drainage metagenome TaxID=410659 RepID=A0A1J5T167_9ZZZZ